MWLRPMFSLVLTCPACAAPVFLQWEPLILAIGLCESYRVALGWATPTGEGFNAVKDDYELGNLG